MKYRKQNNYHFGIWAEKIVIFFLFLKGYRVLHWRFKTIAGEIDIIAKKSRVIAIIEVKARSSVRTAEELLHPKQIMRIKRAAEIFIQKNPQFRNHNLRLDFIEVSKFFFIKHHINFIS